MDNELIFLDDFLVYKKRADLNPVVSLELDDVAKLLILDDGPIALQVLTQRLADFLQVKVVVETLHGQHALAPISLLDAQMHLVPRPRSGCNVGLLERILLVEIHHPAHRHRRVLERGHLREIVFLPEPRKERPRTAVVAYDGMTLYFTVV